MTAYLCNIKTNNFNINNKKTNDYENSRKQKVQHIEQ